MEIRTLHIYPPTGDSFSIQVGSRIGVINAVVSKIENRDDYFAVWVAVDGSPHSNPWKDVPKSLHPIVEYAVPTKTAHSRKS